MVQTKHANFLVSNNHKISNGSLRASAKCSFQAWNSFWSTAHNCLPDLVWHKSHTYFFSAF